jgi:hypothetical protein
MTPSQRDLTVEARAGLILSDEPSARAYGAYFEAQVLGGTVHRLRYGIGRRIAALRPRGFLAGLLAGLMHSVHRNMPWA